MAQSTQPIKDPLTGAETTGHVWDDTLQEFNNPLPRWWLYAFYGTIIFSIGYWILYPAWPFASSFTKGFNTVTYQTAEGQEKTTHWSMRALFAKDMQEGEFAVKQRQYLEKVAATPYDQIAQDPDMSAFVRSYGASVFNDNCAACHQAGGKGVLGKYPSLADNDWLWGGTADAVQHTITYGRNGFMPAFKETFNEEQLTQVSNYVLSLSGLPADADAAAKGERIFNTETGGCYYCHTKAGKGLQSQGAANLTDKVWTIATIDANAKPEDNLAKIKAVISNGVQRQMPVFGQRLNETEIKVLTNYVQQLSAQ